MKKLSFLLITLAIITTGCGGGTQYRDASKDEGSGSWGPKEIKTTTKKMVGSLYTYLSTDWKKPAILQVKKIRNKTSEHIETSMLSEEIATNLIKKKIRFIDETYSKDQLTEIEKGMTGMIDADSAIPAGELKSPNFYLFGEITDNVRNVKGKRLQYLVVTLKLQQLSTGMVMWQEQKEFLKATKTDRISF